MTNISCHTIFLCWKRHLYSSTESQQTGQKKKKKKTVFNLNHFFKTWMLTVFLKLYNLSVVSQQSLTCEIDGILSLKLNKDI